MATIPVTYHVNRARLTIWSKDDIKKISVKEITEPKSFEKGGAIHPDGLYSPALGPTKKFDLCTTCGLSGFNCPGHYGHIELSVPVYHPMLVQILYQILSKCCFHCFHFRLPEAQLTLFLSQLEALNFGFDHLIDELNEIAADLLRDSKTNDEFLLKNELGKKLTARIEEEKEKTPEFDCQNRPQQRSIVERLSKLFRNFMNGHLVKPAKICPHCNEKKTSIGLHQNSVIVIGTGSSKSVDALNDASNKGIRKSKKSKKKHDKTNRQEKNNLNFIVSDDRRYLTPIGAKFFLKQLWDNEKRTMQKIFHFLESRASALDQSDFTNLELKVEDQDDPKKKMKKANHFHPVDNFFIETVMVPPCKFRPPMSQRGYSFEGPRTGALSSVMKQSKIVEELIDQVYSEIDDVEKEKLQVKLQSNWKSLQTAVNTLYDNEMDKYGKNKYPGLKQLIDKKEGLFRKNMMGKRVNFAARSVISPDPNISVDQIGVPLVFAKKLTYPESVTPMNLNQLREAVLNGPDIYPGAHSVVFDDGVTVILTKESVREGIAARLSYLPKSHSHRQTNKQDTPLTTIVNRHLLTGDVLLFNRQPTLHKPSIMAFRARVLPNEKGFRLHYANCKSFNADFDGDEMNAHLPQSELARSEAYNIASVNYQYLVPKDGSPLGGLIQDHVVAVCILTSRDQFLDQERYYQLVYCALAFLEKPILYEPPTIIKPKRIWTGKQVITSIIKNCIPTGKQPPTLNVKSKIEPKLLNIKPEDVDLSDCNVIIRNGELLKGFMDKTNVGATQYGLIHLCYELYGGETSSNLMSAFARLSTMYLQLYEGFTLGIKDIIVNDEANLDRAKLIKESTKVGNESVMEALGIRGPFVAELLEDKMREAHSDRDPLPMKLLDGSMKSRTDKTASAISSRCLPGGLISPFPANNLQMMIQSGAKGGTVNALQISCLLGQIELEGRRVPLSMSGRSLPSFRPYDPSPKAGGFVSGRFLTGIQPQEFFFHCMAGREGLIDTAVKTSRSGYLQRCLIKHLEGITVHYDQTVRDSCGSVIQFLYGEDGLDIVKSQMLKEKAFTSLVNNYGIVKPDDEEVEKLNKSKENYEEDVIAHSDLIQQWSNMNGDSRERIVRGSGFLDFLNVKLNEVKQKLDGGERCPNDEEIIDLSPRSSPSSSQLKKKKKKNKNDSNKEYNEEEGASVVTKETNEESRQDQRDVEMIEGEKEVLGELLNESTGSNEQQQQGNSSLSRIGSHHHDQIFDSWYALSFKEKKKWNKFWEACPDPLTALMNPGSHFGVVPERLDQIIESFVKANPNLIIEPTLYLEESRLEGDGSALNQTQQLAAEQLASAYADNPELSKLRCMIMNSATNNSSNNTLGSTSFKNLADDDDKATTKCSSFDYTEKPKLTKYEFYNLCYNLYMKMLAQPGEAVGLLAAQSIGEPSTQMTLNTFHFAGRGEMNVTLGIPRLREILMTASAKIGTPSMDLPALPVMRDEFGNELDVEGMEKQMSRVRLALNAVRLSDVLEYIDISEQVIDLYINSTNPNTSITGSTTTTPSKSSSIGQVTKRIRTSTKSSSTSLESSPQGRQAIRYVITFSILPSKYYKHEFQCKTSNVMKFIEETFVSQLIDSMLRRQKRLSLADNLFDLSTKRINNTKTGSGGGKSANNNNNAADEVDPEEHDLENYNAEVSEKEKKSSKEEDASSSDDDNNGDDDDGDNTARRLKDRRNQDLDYEEPEDEDLEVGDLEAKVAQVEENEADELIIDVDGDAGDLEDSNHNNAADDDDQQQAASGSATKAATSTSTSTPTTATTSKTATPTSADSPTSGLNRLKDIERIRPYVLAYEHDVKRGRWCKLTLCMDQTNTRLDMAALLDQEARKTYVHRVGNIQRALIVDDVGAKARHKSDRCCSKMIKTEGVSLLSLVRYNHILDLNAIYTNDIHAIANTYGIEAASQAIRREMANVFAVYGIQVDPRHLSLIADYMTYSGSIRGMNRMSMEASASPFQQMSFESTLRYLKSAAILGLYDDIKSPSASLVFGRPTRGGTGLFAPLADPVHSVKK